MKSIKLPLDHDAEFIRREAGVKPWAIYIKDGFKVMEYDEESEAAVMELVEAYNERYLPEAKAKALRRASDERDRRIRDFTFMGLAIELDDYTQMSITKLEAGMEKNPNLASFAYSLGGGEFVTLTRDAIDALTIAAFAHGQAKFSAHAAVAGEIKAATTLAELMSVEVETNEAWNA